MMPLARSLSLGSKGPDVRAVKRALARAGYGPKKLARITGVFGPFTVRWLKKFQVANGLQVDGKYGTASHAKLEPFFDAYARALYAKAHPAVQLPAHFTPTHQTDGLPGYPAIDVFAPGGATALAPEAGIIRRLSGRAPTPMTSPGGPYGWSIYLQPDSNPQVDYFLTHFGERFVSIGDHVTLGQPLGTVADYSAATNGVTPSHIHEGKHTA